MRPYRDKKYELGRRMLGFVVIDAQEPSDQVAVWLTSLVESHRADHVNAVVVERDDHRLLDQMQALAADRAVLTTDGTVLGGLQLKVDPLTSASLTVLLDETLEHRMRITAAVASYGREHGTKPVPPRFYGGDRLADVPLSEESAAGRALRTATILARAWTAWLQSDEQRRRRTVRPQDGGTPWMMPEELNSSKVAPLPARFAVLARSALLSTAARA